MLNVREPPNSININLGDDQKTGISTDMRPVFSTSSWRNESVCWSFEVEIKTADFYSLHKHHYSILRLFTYQVLAFSYFPVGTSINM